MSIYKDGKKVIDLTMPKNGVQKYVSKVYHGADIIYKQNKGATINAVFYDSSATGSNQAVRVPYAQALNLEGTEYNGLPFWGVEVMQGSHSLFCPVQTQQVSYFSNGNMTAGEWESQYQSVQDAYYGADYTGTKDTLVNDFSKYDVALYDLQGSSNTDYYYNLGYTHIDNPSWGWAVANAKATTINGRSCYIPGFGELIHYCRLSLYINKLFTKFTGEVGIHEGTTWSSTVNNVNSSGNLSQVWIGYIKENWCRTSSEFDFVHTADGASVQGQYTNLLFQNINIISNI